jgi:hypothetical protein
MRESGRFVRWRKRPRNGNWPWRNVGAGSTGAHESEPGIEGNAQLNSQDDAPLCFRRLEGYYSSGRPGASSTGWFENILEGQCASRVRLRITQCKRSI